MLEDGSSVWVSTAWGVGLFEPGLPFNPSGNDSPIVDRVTGEVVEPSWYWPWEPGFWGNNYKRPPRKVMPVIGPGYHGDDIPGYKPNPFAGGPGYYPSFTPAESYPYDTPPRVSPIDHGPHPYVPTGYERYEAAVDPSFWSSAIWNARLGAWWDPVSLVYTAPTELNPVPSPYPSVDDPDVIHALPDDQSGRPSSDPSRPVIVPLPKRRHVVRGVTYDNDPANRGDPWGKHRRTQYTKRY